jgi:hypothetical protein
MTTEGDVMEKEKPVSIHKESCLLGMFVELILLLFLGGIIGLCFSWPKTGILVGLLIAVAHILRKTNRAYTCRKCAVDLNLTKVDKENRFEEWTCPQCKCQLIAEFN